MQAPLPGGEGEVWWVWVSGAWRRRDVITGWLHIYLGCLRSPVGELDWAVSGCRRTEVMSVSLCVGDLRGTALASGWLGVNTGPHSGPWECRE